MPSLVKFEILQTWDGAALGASECCTVCLTDSGATWIVEVVAPFFGDPAPSAPRSSLEGLWAFEVVEFFVAAAGVNDSEVAYTEVELSPHGHHLVLRFEGVRHRVAEIEPLAVRCRISHGREGDRWQGRIELPYDTFPPKPWRANAFAMHGLGESRRYLAAAPLPGPRPDFHQPDRFPRLPPLD